MDDFDRFVVALNGVLALVAALANLHSARGATGDWRRVRVSIAAVATAYVLGYAYLAMFPDEIITWSKVMRGVSLLAWPIVWIHPAVVQRRSMKRTKEILEKEMERE